MLVNEIYFGVVSLLALCFVVSVFYVLGSSVRYKIKLYKNVRVKREQFVDKELKEIKSSMLSLKNDILALSLEFKDSKKKGVEGNGKSKN